MCLYYSFLYLPLYSSDSGSPKVVGHVSKRQPLQSPIEFPTVPPVGHRLCTTRHGRVHGLERFHRWKTSHTDPSGWWWFHPETNQLFGVANEQWLSTNQTKDHLGTEMSCFPFFFGKLNHDDVWNVSTSGYSYHTTLALHN